MHLQGKQVLISGASSGIGAAAARAFAAQGAQVLLLARTQPALEAVAQEIRAAGGTAQVYPVDLSDLDAVAHTAAAITREVGVPDVLVNNAGAGRWLAIEETDPAEALQMTLLPYVGAFALTHAFAAAMLARGSGRIVNLTSPAAYTPFPGAVAYSVARGAMRHFTSALAADLRGTGLSAVLVVCGLVDSSYFDHNPGARERLPSVTRFLPTLTPEQAADALVRAAAGKQRRLIVPAPLRWITWLWFAAPGLVQGVVNLSGHRRRT